MLVERRLHAGLRDGTITVVFRRWRRARVVAGRVYRTAAGRIAVDDVSVISPEAITDDDARAAAYGSAADAVADLRGADGDPVFRLVVRFVDTPDPREVLAATSSLDDDEVARVADRLARLDRASRHGPWTRATLELISRRPGTRAGDLAAELGRDTPDLKADVRKLKNLGLTESLRVGYQLSPRGAKFLAEW